MNRKTRAWGMLLLLAAAMGSASGQDPSQWPRLTKTMKPWTRWWWLGSGVDRPNLERMLQQLQGAGEGGVEICPIYGAKGYESRFVSYLSPQWMSLLAYTTQTAAALDLGVDLTTGTGWPMGGPWIPDNEASAHLTVRRYPCPANGVLDVRLFASARSGRRRAPTGTDGLIGAEDAGQRVACIRAVDPDGHQHDLTRSASADGHLRWKAPGPGWSVYAAVVLQPVQQVKRAAPGDQGNVIDPYSIRSLDTFLGRFDQAFRGYSAPAPRAEFHDSFEYYGANWTPDFFKIFQKRRGYDLRAHLPALADDGGTDESNRVREDYRRTIAELHREWVAHWTQWSHGHGSLTREQAHGAPANIEDVYAAADIPETEGSFLGGDDEQIPMLKFSSSAAHVTGRRLASSETFTWLGEHFSVPLSALKPVVDRFFLSGTNHIFFHGTPYSPADAPWPGWLFYASVNFGPNGGIWHDLPAFNAYAARCQSILQGGQPDNDVLLYFPVADYWQAPAPKEPPSDLAKHPTPVTDPLVEQFGTPGKWMAGSPFQALAMELWQRGYSYDAVTDDLLAKARIGQGDRIELGGGHYRAVVVPSCRFLSIETLRVLLAIAKGGGTVVFENHIPADVPGFDDAAVRRRKLKAISRKANDCVITPDVPRALEAAGIPRESMTDQGLQCLRRRRDDGGTDYFVVNCGKAAVDGWVPFARHFAAAVLMDPLAPERVGHPLISSDRVYLQLPPGGSIIVRSERTMTGADYAPSPALLQSTNWNYAEPEGARSARTLNGTWQVHFVEGGPVLPRDFSIREGAIAPGGAAVPAASASQAEPTPSSEAVPAAAAEVARTLPSWTAEPDPEAQRFAGTAVYTLKFSFHSSARTGDTGWRLDLGRVGNSARVRVNGHSAGTLWCPPYACDVSRYLHDGENILQVEVTNLAANRIRDLDRRHVPWKNFYEINFVNRFYKPFDASGWPVMPSGLFGPVTLTPLRAISTSKT